MTMGILTQSSILTKHGDKMIFKITNLSPFKKHSNEDLVSIKNIYLACGQDDFQKSFVSVQYKREILQKIGAAIVNLVHLFYHC